jgi:hypothetical protein
MNATGSPQLNYIAIHKTSVWEACGENMENTSVLVSGKTLLSI